MRDPRERLIVALDVSSAAAAQKIVAAVGDSAFTYKVGKQLFTAEGPQIVRDLVASGRQVFLDLKYHDIPSTVASAVREAAKLHVSMLTVHASGGGRMLRAAVDAARNMNPTLMVLAVTVLTSLDDSDLEKMGVRGKVVDQVLRLSALAIADGCDGVVASAQEATELRKVRPEIVMREAVVEEERALVGVRGQVADQVLRLAALALADGCHGVVASAQEAAELRSQLGDEFAIVTPGVRPAGAGHGDQVRVVTPAEAIAAGATHIVVGRPITQAADPTAEARAILGQISF